MVPDLVSHRGVTLRHGAVALLTAFVVLVMLLTSGQMAGLRMALPPLSYAMSWLEGLPLPLDMDHVVFLMLVAAAMRMMLPQVRWWRLLVLLGVLAAGTELLQFATDGRTPRWQDARDDMLGAAIGLLLGTVPLWCAGYAARLQRLSAMLLLTGIALLPFQQWPLAFAFGFPVLPSDMMFMLALSVRGLALASGCAPMRISGFHGWAATYVLTMLLAVLVQPPLRAASPPAGFVCIAPSPDYMAAVGKWCGIVYLAALGALACDLASRPGSATRMAISWVAAACAASMLSIFAVTAFYLDRDAGWLPPLLSHGGSLPSGDYPTVRGSFNDASMFANFLLVGICLSLALRVQGRIGSRAFMIVLLVTIAGAVPTMTTGLAGIPLALGLAGERLLTDAHNILLNVAGHAGLPALLAFVGLCVWLCVRGWGATSAGSAIAGGALLALVGAVFYDGLTGSFEGARHLWVLMGLLAGASMPSTPITNTRAD